MEQTDAWKETRDKSLTTILKGMGFSEDSFMAINPKETMQLDGGMSFGGNNTDMDLDKTCLGQDGHYAPGVVGSNNGVYAAYTPMGEYIVTKDKEIIKALQQKLNFQDKNLGVLFSNGGKPTNSSKASEWEKVSQEGERLTQNQKWAENTKAEAKEFDGLSFGGYNYSDASGKITTPEGKEVESSVFLFDKENTFGKMSQEFSSKEFESKVYSGEIDKNSVMDRLGGADLAEGDLKKSQAKLADAKGELKNTVEQEKAVLKEASGTENIGSALDNSIGALKAYIAKNPKNASKISSYVEDLIKSSANGQTPKTANPLEPKGFFGKLKNKFSNNAEEISLKYKLANLEGAIKQSPDSIKDFVNSGDYKSIGALKQEMGKITEKNKTSVLIANNKRKEAERIVEGWETANANNAIKLGKFEKLKASVNKIFGDKEAAKEIEQKAAARDSVGIKDVNANTGVDRLADKAKAMEGMSPQQRLAVRLADMRGTAKEEAKPTVKREVDSNILGKTLGDKAKGA